MPYITQGRRIELDISGDPETAGELNYVITKACLYYLGPWGEDNPLSYDRLNEIVGVLECAKLEFYRRLVSPHEIWP